MTTSRYLLTTTFTTSLLSLVAMKRPVQAEQLHFGIYPTVTELRIEPGQTTTVDILVKNFSQDTLTLYPQLQPFSSSVAENGEVSYVQSTPSFFRYVSIKAGEQNISSVTLLPQAEERLSITINTPKSVSTEDQYFSVIFLTKPEPSATNEQTEGVSATTSLSSGVASHLILAMSPVSPERIQLREFSTPTFTQHEPPSFRLRVTNEGKSFVHVSGEVTLRNALGFEIERISLPRTLVLTGSTRSLRSTTPQSESQMKSAETAFPLHGEKTLPIPGIYRATVSLRTDRAEDPIDKTIYFVVAPLQLLFSLLCIIVLFYAIKKGLTRHSHREG